MMRRATCIKLCSTRRHFLIFYINSTESPDIILEDVNVGEEYGIGRLFRRGAEVRDLNTRVPEPGISAIN